MTGNICACIIIGLRGGVNFETDLSTKNKTKKKRTWLQKKDEH